MISKLKGTIALKLKELYSTSTIYDEDIPQNFKKKSFLISVVDHVSNKRGPDIFNNVLSLDIAYFSDKDKTEIKTDCLWVQQNLLREFDLVGKYHIFNKQANITDNVLHITFDIKYSELKTIEEIKLQNIQSQTRVKE